MFYFYFLFTSEPISLDQIVNCEQDVAALMGFTGFSTTKNKKVCLQCGSISEIYLGIVTVVQQCNLRIDVISFRINYYN